MWGTKGQGGEYLELLARLQFCHFLHIDPDALAVKQHKVDGFDGGWHGVHKVAGDGLEDQLGRRLLWKPIPDRKENTFSDMRSKAEGFYLLTDWFEQD